MLYLFAYLMFSADWHVWVADGGELKRIDEQGKVMATAALGDVGAVTSVAMDRVRGRVVATATDYVSKSSVVVADESGRVLVRQSIAGIPSAVAVDSTGNIFVSGLAREGFQGTAGAFKLSFGEKACSNKNGDLFACEDAFLMKLRMDGTVVWSTLFGGSLNDSGKAIAIDPSGSIWIAGETRSTNMPVSGNALQKAYGGGETLGPIEYGDAFVARFDASGARLEYSTYLGGARYDAASSLVTTKDGVVVAGTTESPNFPLSAGAFQKKLANETVYMPGVHTDAFVSVISRSGELSYSTYFGEEGRQSAGAAVAGAGDRAGVALTGFSKRCVAWVDASLKFTPECHAMELQEGFAVYPSGDLWIAVGRTKLGWDAPGVERAGGLRVEPFDADRVGPGVIGVWNDATPGFRPLFARDSYVSVYTSPAVDLRQASVLVGGRQLKIVYAGGGQINAYVPADLPLGRQQVVIGLPFFISIATDVDVVERWPGLASAALNEDGTVNSAANPAARGTIVSLFGSGFGNLSQTVLEPYVQSTGVTSAQGMQLIYAGRVAEGLSQFNVRIPMNAVAGHTPVKVTIRDGSPYLLSSNLAKIYIR